MPSLAGKERSLHACRASAHDDDSFLFFCACYLQAIFLSRKRVHRTGPADAFNTFLRTIFKIIEASAYLFDLSCLSLDREIRISEERTAHSHKISIAVPDDLFRQFRCVDLPNRDDRYGQEPFLFLRKVNENTGLKIVKGPS
jgi:hypothetical protein